jgi:outer membrane protein OmpA-like peptidoglycan-associated protein
MKLRIALLAATVLAAPFAVHAQPVSGLYIAGGAGANLLQDTDVKHISPTNKPGIGHGSNFRYDVGPVVVGSIGYGLGNGLRFELEGTGMQNKVNRLKDAVPGGASGNQYKYGAFINALYDIPLALPVVPYVGIGAGYLHNQNSNVKVYAPGQLFTSNGQSDNLAAQAIVGASYPLYAYVPGLSLTAEYRFVSELGGRGESGKYFAGASKSLESMKFGTDNFNHEVLVGFRYAFNTVAPVPPAPMVAPVPAPAPARTYLVFFDWDRADLTDRARQIIAEAAAASTRVSYTKIEVQGNADRSGTPQYNLGLSKRRAETVAAELVRRGVPRTAIDIQAFGDTRPLVPTAAGVREPQNRRVAIILR